MRSAKRTAKLSIVGGAVNPASSLHRPILDRPTLESPLAERVGGWPARSAVLSSPNQGMQGGSSPHRPDLGRPALFIVTWVLLMPVCLLMWAVIIMTVYKFLHW